tara:strand:- start:1514 stop:1957 length:444 start_codon:yes stop_codon:yes gene_type:complete
MATASCALCGASNTVMRVYIGMQHPRPNLLAISCTECGKVSSQLRTLPDYAAFAVIYSLISLGFVIAGMQVLGDSLDIGWIAAIAATIPFAFLPAWWAIRQAAQIAELAPQPDLTLGQKLGYLGIAILIIGGIIGGGLALFLIYGPQ